MQPTSRLRILCVDDEPLVLEGLALHLRRRYDLVTAASGAAGLEHLERDASIAVVMSDMRMPGMDGAAFLGRARQAVPDVVRMLLTGQADLESAAAAINEGQIFRFLTKPCAPAALLAAVDAAAAQHRLLTAERVLLEQTLHGSIKMLTDVLAITNPIAFGRATRIKQLVADLAAKLGIREVWQVELAAMLSQLGFITLPAETVEKVYYGKELSEPEQAMVARAPAVTEQLVGHIPRLEAVRGILATCARPSSRGEPVAGLDPARQLVQSGAQLLRVALDFDALEAQGNPAPRAIDTMRGRAEGYDPRVVEALAACRGSGGPREDIRELPLSALRVGMIFVEDVKMTSGALLVARGYEVTQSFVARAQHFRRGTVKEPVRVVIRGGAKAAA